MDHNLAKRSNRSGTNFYAYSKLIGTVSTDQPASSSTYTTFHRSNKVNVALKDATGFRDALSDMNSADYQNTGGSDLSNLFMPFQTVLGPRNSLPGLHTGVRKITNISGSGEVYSNHLYPFDWNPNGSGTLKDRWASPSGDGYRDLLSSERVYGDVNQYRDMFNIRGIGLRLPIMGVGWGYTLDKVAAVPSGTDAELAGKPKGTRIFKGGSVRGWQVDPSDYIAAPIDFRYDPVRHVWTCAGGGDGMPPGTGRFKVMQLVTDDIPGVPGWDYIRFPSPLTQFNPTSVGEI